MEAPFRFPIERFEDLERLLAALDTSPLLVPGSLRLSEGLDVLARQLADEGRDEGERLRAATTAQGMAALLHALWQQPLAAQRPRFVRFEADTLGEPPLAISVRVDVPAAGAYPRWVDVEGARDREELAALHKIYRALAEQAGLSLQEV